MKNVTHLAVLRNWFEVVNQNPIFRTDGRHPEIMEVFAFDPRLTHITPKNAGEMTEAAAYYVSLGNIQQAGSLLQQSLQIDPQSSKTHLALGHAFLAAGKLDKAEAELRTASQLHPDYWEAQLALAQIAARRCLPEEAAVQMESIVRRNPSYREWYQALAQLYETYHLDSLKAAYYLREYNNLTDSVVQ